jgi:sortase A
VSNDEHPSSTRDGSVRARRRVRTPSKLVVPLLVGLAALSVLTFFFGAFALGLSGLQEQRSQDLLYASFRGVLDPSSPVAPSVGGAIAQGTPVALLTARAAGIDNEVVVEGTTASDLLSGPGHLSNSPLPGQAGESILMGRSVTAGAPFANVTRLHKGDRITVTTGEGTFAYVVEGTRVGGDPLPTIPKSGGLLTLVTSAGAGWLGTLTPGHLVYVDAILQGTVAPTPPGRPATIAADEVQGAAQPSSMPFVVLWFLGFAATSAAAVWLWRRWGALRTWLLVLPILLGVLWGFSTEAMRLLPNVY